MPDEIKSWTVENVGQWIRSLNTKLEGTAQAFEKEGVDGEMLLVTSEEILVNFTYFLFLCAQCIFYGLMSTVSVHRKKKFFFGTQSVLIFFL